MPNTRMIASTVKDKKLAIIYRSTKAEPISIIPAKEKMALEESRPDGLCVGKPVRKELSGSYRHQMVCCIDTCTYILKSLTTMYTKPAMLKLYKPGHVYILIGERYSAWLLILYNYIVP